MNKVIRLGMLFNEGDVPDFGSIVEDIHQRGLYYLLAKDIPKLNTMVTRAAAENYLIGNETFDFFSGYMAYVIDHKEAGTGEIYAYHRGKDHWYEFNIRLDKSFNYIMWERHKRIMRETKTISGTSPLTFKSNGRPLKNYRIYGNTETKTRSYSGAAPLSFPITNGTVNNYRVYGQTSRNLFGVELTDDYHLDTTNGLPVSYSGRFATLQAIIINQDEYCLTYNSTTDLRFMYSVFNNDTLIRRVSRTNGRYLQSGDVIDTTNGNKIYFAFYKNDQGAASTNVISDIMLNAGSTSLPYEPYGESVGSLVTDSQSEHYGKYAIPITNNSETANIYLDEPLKKIGDYTDYIEYAEQKRYNADGTSEDVTLPALPAQSSTNSLSVDTTIQPSSVAVDVDEIVNCGDKITDSQSVNYGKYKIPVTLTAGSAETNDIYLDTPLAKSGNSADYIDYATQKRHNSDGTESSLTLPEIAVTAGTNTLTIGTEVQPSSVEIKGRIKAAGGD